MNDVSGELSNGIKCMNVNSLAGVISPCACIVYMDRVMKEVETRIRRR